MKISLLYKIPALLFVLLIASCNEDEFLSVDPIGVLSSDVYLQTDEEVKAVVVGIYDAMQENFSSGAWTSLYFVKNLPADDCLAGSTEGDQAGYQNIDDFEIQSDNDKIEGVWSNLYKAISTANTIINKVDGDTDLKVKMIAEAKALRAYNYFELVTLFGGVPLMIVNPTDEAEYHLPRSTAAAVYAQIETDLTEAIADLPLKSEYSSGDRYRMSKGAAQAYLGKVYLYQKKYAEAETQFANVISSGEYDLEPDFANVWSVDGEFGPESLFEISYTAQEVYDWGTFPWDGTNESNIEVQLQGPRSSLFDISESSLNILNGWGFNMPSAEIGQAFIDAGDAIRMASTVMSAADFEATGGVIVDDEAHDYEGYMRVKYVTTSSETSTSGIAELNYSTNWRLMRYADVLLMAAEAYHFNNNDAQALIELNKVRDRANLAEVTVTGDALFNAIVSERQLELAFEGCRYWDLVRWGLASSEMSDIGYVTGKHELFPIPINEIIANTSISPEDQNPGY